MHLEHLLLLLLQLQPSKLAIIRVKPWTRPPRCRALKLFIQIGSSLFNSQWLCARLMGLIVSVCLAYSWLKSSSVRLCELIREREDQTSGCKRVTTFRRSHILSWLALSDCIDSLSVVSKSKAKPVAESSCELPFGGLLFGKELYLERMWWVDRQQRQQLVTTNWTANN